MLAHHGIAFEARDLFRNPLTLDKIRALAGRASVGTLDDQALMALMAEDPRPIRRPLMLSGDTLVIGADAAAIVELAPS